MKALKGKTLLISGGSRGIGLAIAVRFAEEGANVSIATKDSPEGIEEAKSKIAVSGAQPLILDVDVSDVSSLKKAAAQTAERFGGIDVLVNNTSATCFLDTLKISPVEFDRVFSTSARAAFFLSQACHPFLKKSSNPHILNISPPLFLEPALFKNHLAFSLGKYAMSFCTLGMAEEFKKEGIAVNSLWPETTIATQTIKDHFSDKVYRASRWPSIMADAAFELVSRDAKTCTGRFFTDEALLKESGIADFSRYAVDPDASSASLMQALFLPSSLDRHPVPQDLFQK